ncbi:MAG TPA: hypothetical protein VFR99_11730 [Marmoricola sp.]|nr:hypothetical protein [Marmoricola sp.]
MSDESRLSESLHRKASGFSPETADMAQIVHRARGIRRRRRTAATALAAAAVAAIAVPTALTLGGGPQAGIAPGPAHSGSATASVPQTPQTTPPSTPPTTSSTSPASPTPTAQPLSDIPMGSPLEVTYLHDGTVHYAGGGTAQLPGDPSGVSGFASYHGGWLVVDQDANTITQYDNAGNVVRSGRNGALAVSGATAQTAFQIGTTIRVGTPTGEGEQIVPAGTGGLVGLLGSGVVYNDGTVMLAEGSGKTRQIEGLDAATTTYVPDDLVGGFVSDGHGSAPVEGGVVSAKTGAVLWHNEWLPLAFSQDGKYVAAVPAGDNGDLGAVAILDAADGSVVSQMPLVDNKRYLHDRMVLFGQDDSALFPVDDATGHETVVRLTTDGKITRTTPIAATVGTAPAYVLATQP